MATLVTAEPQLYVRDIGASAEFYVGTLGFSLAFTYGDPPFYGQVFRDGARLSLRHVDDPVIDPARRDRDQLLAASIAVDDASPLFAEYEHAGVEFVQGYGPNRGAPEPSSCATRTATCSSSRAAHCSHRGASAAIAARAPRGHREACHAAIRTPGTGRLT